MMLLIEAINDSMRGRKLNGKIYILIKFTIWLVKFCYFCKYCSILYLFSNLSYLVQFSLIFHVFLRHFSPAYQTLGKFRYHLLERGERFIFYFSLYSFIVNLPFRYSFIIVVIILNNVIVNVVITLLTCV